MGELIHQKETRKDIKKRMGGFKMVKQSRKKLNLTQVQLAPLLGVSPKSIKNYEQGIRKPSKAVLMLLDGLMKENER
jgi:DNA-binding transcriptional regulator YiaG